MLPHGEVELAWRDDVVVVISECLLMKKAHMLRWKSINNVLL